MPTALVTGASSGIGLELARCFAADRVDLVLVARRRGRLEELAAELRKAHNVKVRVLDKDLSRPAAAEEIYLQLEAEGLDVDYLVNNAGFGDYGRFKDMSQDVLDAMVSVNVLSLTQLTRRYLPHMIGRGSGGVLNVGSTGSFGPCPLMPVYCATKAYVLSLTEAIASECRGTGVKVSCLCPGATKTEFQERAGVGSSPMTRFFTMDAEEVAKSGYNAFMKDKTVHVTGWANKLMIFAIRFTPRSLVAWTSRKILSRGD